MRFATIARHPGATAGGVLVAVAAVVRIPPLLAGVHDYDEGVYWESLRSLGRGQALFSSVYSSQPPAFLPLMEPAYALFGHDLTGARLGVLLLALVGVVAGVVAVSELAGRRAGLLAGALLAVDPLLLRGGVTLQAEVPATALALIALAIAARSRRVGGGRGELLAAAAGAALAIGVLTKLLDAAAIPAIALVVAAPPQTALEPSARHARRRLTAASAGGTVTIAAVLAPFAGRLTTVVQQSVGLHIASRSVDEGGLSAVSGALRAETPLLLLAAVATVWAFRRAPLAVGAFALWALSSVVALSAQHPLWPHHLIALTAPGCLLAALVAVPPSSTAGWRPRAVAVVASAALICALAGVSTATWLGLARESGDQTATAAQVGRLASLVPPGSVIVTDDQAAAAAADLDTPPGLVDTSLVRILSGDLRIEEVETALTPPEVAGVLFATTRLDHLEGLRSWVRQRFPVADDIGGGKILYRRG